MRFQIRFQAFFFFQPGAISMKPFAKSFFLYAWALAVAVLLSACGGGALSPDATPPTVAIKASAATLGGPVTFTFTFSKDVGSSFTAEDVVVTGGNAAATVTKVDATHYTLLVTPTGSGAVTASVAAAKFNDVSNVANTVAAMGATSTAGAIDFSGVDVIFNAFEGLISATVDVDPTNPVNKVAKLVKGPSGQPWAGATIYTAGVMQTDPAVHSQLFVAAADLATQKTVNMKVYTAAAVGTKITLKFENAADPGVNVAAEAVTTKQSAWETLTFNFAAPTTGAVSASATYNTVSVFPAFSITDTAAKAPTVDTIFYFDDLTYKVAGGSSGGSGAGGAPTNAPTTTIPAGAVTIYSDAASVAGFNPFPNWGQSTTYSEVTIANNKSLKYVFGSATQYEGLDWSANPVDVSAKGKLHLDLWTPDLTSVKVSIISTGKESAYTQTLTAGSWNSVDIALSNYTVPDLKAIIQIKLETTTAGTLYVDNIYFGSAGASVSCGTTAPTCAPTTTIPAGALTIYSDAASVASFNPFPNWGQSTTYSEVTIANNKSLKYVFGTATQYEGLDWSANPVDVSAKGKLHLDLWSADLTSVKVSLISTGKENAYTQAVTAGSWNSVDIDLSNYTVADKTAIIQIKLETTAAGTLYVDNIYFWGTASSGGGGGSGTPNPSAAAGSAGPVTIPLLSASLFGDFGAAGNAVFAGDYIGGIDVNGNHATWGTATSNGVANNGNIGYFQDNALSTSAQKLEENGWVAGLIDNAAGVPSFFRYFILTAPASTFTNSYMGLFANAPNNGTVDVSSYGNIKFRLWGPAEMYQDASFSPTLEMKLTGPKVAGCTATGSGATEIKKTFVADQKIGAASTYKLSLAGWSIVGTCGTDTTVASVLSKLAQVVVTVPGTSFNFTHANAGGTVTTYTTGLNLGPIIFTAN
jgi:hypothetical protein